MCARPVRHMRQWPQNRWVSAATKAPTSGWWTSGPTAATAPGDLVSERHREPVDAPGRPWVPVVDVQVRAADRGGLDLDQDLTGAGLWDGNLVQARPGAGLRLPERPHRRRLAHALEDTRAPPRVLTGPAQRTAPTKAHRKEAMLPVQSPTEVTFQCPRTGRSMRSLTARSPFGIRHWNVPRPCPTGACEGTQEDGGRVPSVHDESVRSAKCLRRSSGNGVRRTPRPPGGVHGSDDGADGGPAGEPLR